MDELLRLLKTNALESPANLARLLDCTEEEVKARIADYERRGVIRGYQAIVNEDQLPVDRVTAVIEVRMSPDREGGYDHLAHRIGRFPEVDAVFLMSGGYDLLVTVKGRTLKDVAFFVSDKLATIAGVLNTSTHFLLKTYKDSGVLMAETSTEERLPVVP